jgi:hypothetical protein
MPSTLVRNAVRLEFAPDSVIHANLSGAAFCGEWLWLAGDEASEVSCLRRLSPAGAETLRYGDARSFPLAGLLDLPGADDEADLEGLSMADGWLWLVGSHGLKRKNVKHGKTAEENARRLTRVTLDGNRRLLACLPVETDADGRPAVVRKAKDGRAASLLEGDAEANMLTRLLEKDAHFGPFMTIPGKDNGFDIEGLAVDGQRLLLGLRGPVLRGWSALLEMRVELNAGQIHLLPLDDADACLEPAAHVLVQPDAVHVVVERLLQRDAQGGRGRRRSGRRSRRRSWRTSRAAAAAASRRSPAGRLPTGECTVQAKRWKKPDWMQPSANSWRTYSSASTVSCTVCVGKPYIR